MPPTVVSAVYDAPTDRMFLAELGVLCGRKSEGQDEGERGVERGSMSG